MISLEVGELEAKLAAKLLEEEVTELEAKWSFYITILPSVRTLLVVLIFSIFFELFYARIKFFLNAA